MAAGLAAAGLASSVTVAARPKPQPQLTGGMACGRIKALGEFGCVRNRAAMELLRELDPNYAVEADGGRHHKSFSLARSQVYEGEVAMGDWQRFGDAVEVPTPTRLI
jgi:hypothetical protein